MTLKSAGLTLSFYRGEWHCSCCTDYSLVIRAVRATIWEIPTRRSWDVRRPNKRLGCIRKVSRGESEITRGPRVKSRLVSYVVWIVRVSTLTSEQTDADRIAPSLKHTTGASLVSYRAARAVSMGGSNPSLPTKLHQIILHQNHQNHL